MTHEEIQELLGAYALDAVDGDEHDAVELHLRECPRCRAEVAEHREVASLLAHAGVDAPTGVWDRISAELEGGPPAELAMVRELRPRRRWVAGVAAAVATVAAAVAAVLGVRVADLSDRIDRMVAAAPRAGLTQAALAASADPDARRVRLVSTDGSSVVVAVLLPDGTGYLVDDDLEPLPRDRTYQLWAVIGDQAVSAGVIGPDPGVVPFTVRAADVRALAVTAEEAGGVVTSQNDPVVVGPVEETA